MNIIYVGRFDRPQSNDDEGAILHALRALGHNVDPIRESVGRNAWRLAAAKGSGPNKDFALVHHWTSFDQIKTLAEFVPVVFWCFDLIDFPDQTIKARCRERIDWVGKMTDVCKLGFMTDGDWVAKDTTGKLNWLTQGADERVLGRGMANRCPNCGHIQGDEIQILFVGGSNGGQARSSFVKEMNDRYGPKFRHIPGKVYKEDLRNTIAKARIVVAPDGPITDRYWSNRIYLTAGYAGFMIHPYCRELYFGGQYTSDEIPYYRNRDELHAMIDTFLPLSQERKNMSDAALEKTQSTNLYRHRCEKLIRIVQEKLYETQA